jgi:tetratricopeptide (TPR) repeat protein
VATFLQIPALIKTLDHRLSWTIISEMIPEKVENWGVDYKNGVISFVSGIKIEYSEFITVSRLLPQTCRTLGAIAAKVFINFWMKETDFTANQFQADSDEDCDEIFKVGMKAYDTLGSTGIFSEFSLLETYSDLYDDIPYSDLHKHIISKNRSDKTLSLYQQFLETSIQYNPGDTKALAVLGLCHQWGNDSDKFVKAKYALERLMKIDPSAETRIALAELLFTGAKGVEKDRERAIAILENGIVPEKPTNPLLYVALAHLLRESGKAKEALLLLRQFDDTTKNYSELLSGDPAIIRGYWLYQRALDGETFTYGKVEASLGTRLEPLPFFFGMTVYLIRNDLVVRAQDIPVEIWNRNLSRLQREQFECTYPLLRDIVNHYSEELKEFISSVNPQVKRLLSE